MEVCGNVQRAFSPPVTVTKGKEKRLRKQKMSDRLRRKDVFVTVDVQIYLLVIANQKYCSAFILYISFVQPVFTFML